MRSGVGLIQVSVGGREPVWFCVDPDADEPVADGLLAQGRFDEAAERLALDLTAEGARVLDVGCGIGVFALPAAAAGAEVVAVDDTDARLELLWSAAARNGFERLRPVHADPAAGLGDAPRWPGLDAILEDVGWDAADLIRLDTGGAEGGILDEALCLQGPGRPGAIVVRCDAAGLIRHGSSVEAVLELIRDAGYVLYLVDPLRPGKLVEAKPRDLQPANRTAYLALADRVDLPPSWHVAPRLDRDEVTRRVIETAATDDPAERLHAAKLVARGPAWLRAEPGVAAARRALEIDVSPRVRAASLATRSGDEVDADGPAAAETVRELVVVARDVSVRSTSAGFERPAGAIRPDELVLRGVSLHLRAGNMLGVLVEDAAAATALLSLLGGIGRPAEGSLHAPPRPLLVSGLDRLVEPGLTVEQNIVILGTMFGGHPADIAARTPRIAGRIGLGARLTRRLADVGHLAVWRLGFTVALEFAAAGLLLIDCLPELEDADLRRSARDRLGDHRARGGAVVQAVRDPSHLLAWPDRLLWVAGGSVVACGHPESVASAFLGRAPRPASGAAHTAEPVATW